MLASEVGKQFLAGYIYLSGLAAGKPTKLSRYSVEDCGVAGRVSAGTYSVVLKAARAAFFEISEDLINLLKDKYADSYIIEVVLFSLYSSMFKGVSSNPTHDVGCIASIKTNGFSFVNFCRGIPVSFIRNIPLWLGIAVSKFNKSSSVVFNTSTNRNTAVGYQAVLGMPELSTLVPCLVWTRREGDDYVYERLEGVGHPLDLLYADGYWLGRGEKIQPVSMGLSRLSKLRKMDGNSLEEGVHIGIMTADGRLVSPDVLGLTVKEQSNSRYSGFESSW